MIISPQNNLIVTIPAKFYDQITFESGVTLYKDTGFHPEESAMLAARVISVPRTILKREDYKGMRCDIKPGDTILMRYDVVFSYKNQPDRDTPIYKNMLYYQGQEYWLCDIQKVFAVIKSNEPTTYLMQNGYVMCDKTIENRGDQSSLIVTPEGMRNVERKDRLLVSAIGLPLDGHPLLRIVPGRIVYCSPGVVQSYESESRKFCIIKQSHIEGVEV